MNKVSAENPSPRTGAAADAFGGVVIDTQHRVLLREPANHYGGYVWTFAKGRPDPGETPQETALREVREELGVEAEIIESLPRFLLMRYVRDAGKPSSETQQTRWASLAEARTPIQQTTIQKGRERDLAVLDSVQQLLSKT